MRQRVSSSVGYHRAGANSKQASLARSRESAFSPHAKTRSGEEGHPRVQRRTGRRGIDGRAAMTPRVPSAALRGKDGLHAA
mmetsp:Transcript_123826/g.321644  ORF Transcript_123826/g.321644 Transcript_123826/m.321644 type:complete len:81 (-) Transcript_123826:599-841(-)